jgi:peroxiredoxin
MKDSILRLSNSLLVAAVLALSCAASPAVDEDAESAPTFDLAALDGGRVQSSSFEGKVLLLEFWATWCGPCVAQARILEPIHRDFADRGVDFVAISLGEDASTVRAYVDRTPFPYRVLIDPDDELSGRLGIFALPTVMIVDKAGHVTYRQPGLSSGDVLRRVLEEALAG